MLRKILSLNISHVSSIKELLLRKGGAALHRQVFVLAGSEKWQKEFLSEEILGFEDEALWVADQDPESIPFIETNKARSWLGNEKRIVIFDANKEFDPDSFAAITGIVIGGGIFFLLFPAKEKWNHIYSSYFGQRLLRSINNSSELTLISQDSERFELVCKQQESKSAKDCSLPFLTSEQQSVVESIEKNVLECTNNPIVLISDRGRGKSSALGLAAARLLISGIKNIAITAPRLRATDIIFKRIAELLPDAEISRGYVKYGESIIQFFSPDNLIHDDVKANLLFVDEAAAIPVPLLTSFLHKYSQCVFSTTVHGYEGTGRGFTLRFFKELDKHNSHWLKLNIKTPVRWAENDPLENWMFYLLCLDAEIVDVGGLGTIDYKCVQNHLLKKEQLVDNELLHEVFSLLVLAHYRTRPKDLKSLLDDENISVYVTTHNQHVIAVALVIREGSFLASLSNEVYRGNRRLQGHLLAQALTYHCGIELAATLDYSRVMRIAVHPNLQQKGIGTKLLQFIISNETKLGRDAIGTSFGMNTQLLTFWRKLDFDVVRIGFTREQTSGEHAAVMLLALSDEGKSISNEAIQQFKEKSSYWFDDVLKDLTSEIKLYFNFDNLQTSELTALDKKDLHTFVEYSRNYELCIAALNKFAIIKADDIANITFPDDFSQVINKKILERKDWKTIGKEMNLSGKNEARDLFHQAIVNLIGK